MRTKLHACKSNPKTLSDLEVKLKNLQKRAIRYYVFKDPQNQWITKMYL